MIVLKNHMFHKLERNLPTKSQTVFFLIRTQWYNSNCDTYTQ